jgi:fluoroquinolone transport system ATP-binding protein
MFEFPNHFTKLSAIENLKLFQSLYSNKSQDLLLLLEKVGLQEDTNTRVANFSKGMKTRLSFIRSILHNPSLLFLDEPTSGLDPMNARLIKQMILDLRAQKKTIFLTTHNMHDAEELCDRVGFIAKWTTRGSRHSPKASKQAFRASSRDSISRRAKKPSK